MSRSSSVQMDRRSSGRLHLSGGSRRSLKEVDETLSAAVEVSTSENDGRNDKMYVAVAKEFATGKDHLVWVLKNNPMIKKIVLIHVHVPSPVVPMKGAWFPANQLEPEEVKAYRQIEQETMQRALNEYIDGCSSIKEVQVEKLVIEADDIGQGLLQLISQHRITNLVMGAAGDKHYTNNMKEPKSRKALMLQQEAASLCKIWFICKGNLICTREAELYGSGTMNVQTDIPPRQSESNLKTSPQIHGKYLSFYLNTIEDALKKKPLSITSAPNNEAKMGAFVQEKHGYPSNPESKGEIVLDLLEGISKGSGSSIKSVNEKIFSNTSSIRILMNEEMEGEPFILPLEEARLDDELYKDLKHAVTEAKNLTQEAYEHSMGCQKAERDLHEAPQKAKTIKQRREIEARPSLEKRESEELKRQLGEMFEELQESHEQIESLELQLADSRKTSRDLKKKLFDTHYFLTSLQHKYVELRSERDDAIREAEQLRQKIVELMADGIHGTEIFTEFSYSQLEQATNNFDPSLKVGEGGYGSVYKGVLCQKTVAIKMLNSEGMQGQKEFHKELNHMYVEKESTARIKGVCPEAWALVYDFLPNGSLEDRLNRKDNTPPLPWPLRLRIATEICAALVFLHSNPDLTVVHGDLKPANILLGADFVTKLADFGISGLLQASNNSTALYRCTHAMGTFVYMDPEFLASGDLTPRSDVYSLGIIILQLLTGRPAFGINRAVQDAVEGECLGDLLDAAAGEWPRGKAEQLAQLGLRCCAIVRKSRPDAREALRLLEAIANSPTPSSK
ncbi:hypothetical protein ZIOFF_070766 [Zingiber officinale]|uniref:RING-type E3 ubiquitin transferase n=1 Tax=Zingiber officinale TaxID=94328 RepID=A0A8J5EQ37_ZINOF|nr:hypothetical protein ZIOFF_070766 [Zingiber officinale]